MAKTKSAQPDKAAKSSKDAQVKPLSSVKQGAVSKPSQTPKIKSKEMAKQVAVKADKAGKGEKKSKKPKREPTPVPSSESESDSEDEEEEEEVEDDGASSVSSDESEAEVPAPTAATKTNGVKPNGVAKAAPQVEQESSDSSASSDEEDEEDDEDEDDDETKPTAPKSAPAAAAKAAVASANAKEESESEGDSEEDSSDEESVEEESGTVDAKALNGKLEKVASKEVSDEESGSEATSSGTSEGSSSEEESDEGEEEETPAVAPKKRKAEAETAPVAKKSKTEPTEEATNNLFVGRLSYNVDEEWLTREFEGFGELTGVRVITDRDSGRSKGYGYVEFANGADGVKAQQAMHEAEIDGRTINVDFSKPKASPAQRQDRSKSFGDNLSPPSNTIFVANLDFEATEETVATEFQKHGSVIAVRLPTDQVTGRPKGYGYVQFGSVEEAQEVFGKMNGALVLGRPIRVDYSTPRPPRDHDSPRGRGGFDRGRGGRGGFDRGGRGGGRGRGGSDRGGRGGGRGGRGGSTNRGGFGDFQGKKMSLS